MRWFLGIRVALLIIFLFIVGLVIRSYTSHRQSATSLLKAVDTLERDNPSLHLMDSALVMLNEAESNFRLYTALYDKNYLRTFGKQMDTVSVLLDSAGQPVPGSNPATLDNLVKRKSAMADKIAMLKKTTDSMLVGSIQDNMMNRLLAGVKPFDASRIKREAVVYDTLKTGAGAAPKRGLFKRLGQAIANKKDTVASQMVITVRTKSGETMTKEEYEARQLRNILNDVNAYYKGVLRKQLEGRTQINVAEHSLAGTNLILLQDLKGLIQTTKSQVRQEEAAQKASAGLMANTSVNDMKWNVIWFLVGAFALAALLIYAWYRNREYQRKLQAEKDKALETARARSVFMANMSHEIRTPLNSIVGFGEQLDHTSLNPQQREMVRAIEISSDMLMQVVNDVLDFSKLESDYISVQKKPFVLYQALGEVASTMRIQATVKQLDFQLFFEGDRQQQVAGDVFRLKQILMNLVGNAIKYTDKGSVTLRASLENKGEKQVLFAVSIEDTGPGISADLLPRIFERYYQTRSARVASKGTGLGLAITKRLVELHGGTIQVESEPGKGSKFTCHIPFETVAVPQVIEGPIPTPDQLMEGVYVLVADDQEMNLLLMKMLLTRWKCRFDMARDGKTAHDLFESNQYDLVLLDLQMPNLSGIDVVKHIRASHDREKAAVPVLAITADVTQDDEKVLKEAGFSDWAQKPFKEKDLYNTIAKHLKRKGRPSEVAAQV